MTPACVQAIRDVRVAGSILVRNSRFNAIPRAFAFQMFDQFQITGSCKGRNSGF
ncbi:hypothetical protein H634G_08003 [Metarhizium anisopliae BRIP 53293]|uniref:Uncharacterized protein n=1 Tax=Metarhizium anisopliae BRIP 53293 TaxID=1291518 RepID=A0A0D9NSZ2_METAN|nr:hypothetical protein H634G_08003 [Metarhizium anisopliae BRIP 53293]KJK86111.1 hypothetical protein H633G_10046 [Metarhizium anisopliae BRIP 53284]